MRRWTSLVEVGDNVTLDGPDVDIQVVGLNHDAPMNNRVGPYGCAWAAC